MNQKNRALTVPSALLAIITLMSAILMSAVDPYNMPGPFPLHEQLSEGMARALEQGSRFEDIQKHLLQHAEIGHLSQMLASWKLAKQNPQEHKKNQENLRAYCLQLHPNKQDECEKLIDSVSQVITGGQTGEALKNSKLTSEEIEAARSLRKQVNTTILTILQQGKDLEKIREFLEQSLHSNVVKENIDVLEKNHFLFCAMLKAQKMAKQAPNIHRAFLASFLERCIKIRPKNRDNCKITTALLALIYCANQEEKFIHRLNTMIPSYKKGDSRQFLPDLDLPMRRQRIIEQFPADNLKNDDE